MNADTVTALHLAEFAKLGIDVACAPIGHNDAETNFEFVGGQTNRSQIRTPVTADGGPLRGVPCLSRTLMAAVGRS
jgi:hypothetical protein